MGTEHTCGCGHGRSDNQQDSDDTTTTNTCGCGTSCGCGSTPAEPVEHNHISRIIQSVTDAFNR